MSTQHPLSPEFLHARYPGWHAHAEVVKDPWRYSGILVTLTKARLCDRCGRHHQVQGAVIDDRGIVPMINHLDYAVNAVESMSH
jgi:hypothetical protein